jgi:hypothetical protein
MVYTFPSKPVEFFKVNGGSPVHLGKQTTLTYGNRHPEIVFVEFYSLEK